METRDAAYFYFTQESPEGEMKQFVFKLLDRTMIKKARELLSTGDQYGSHVRGKIVKEPAPYNNEWSFHLDPSTIAFFENNIELCDANVTWVEKNLCSIGGSSLPGLIWCPWSSQLAGEITQSIDPETEVPIESK